MVSATQHRDSTGAAGKGLFRRHAATSENYLKAQQDLFNKTLETLPGIEKGKGRE